MEIKIDDIPSQGRKIEDYKDDNLKNILLESEFEVDKDLSISLFLILNDDILNINGTVSGNIKLDCGKCLTKFSFPINIEIQRSFNPLGDMPDKDAYHLKKEELDIDYYSSNIFNLDDLIKEEILLTIPMKPICNNDCKGFCPKCGQNLNISKCNCINEVKESSFSGLQDLIKRSK